MPRLPGVNHLDAVRALQKVGYRILRQGKHIIMTNGVRRVSVPRHNPVNAITMAGIVRDAGHTIDEFRALTLTRRTSRQKLADHANNSLTTRAGSTPVRRWSRPRYR